MTVFRVTQPTTKTILNHATSFNVASIPTTPISVPTVAELADTIID